MSDKDNQGRCADWREPYRVEVLGLPDGIPEGAAAAFRGRLSRHARELFDETGLARVELKLRRDDIADDSPTEAAAARPDPTENGELDLEGRMSYFTAVQPSYDLSRLVLSDDTMDELMLAIDTVRLRDLVFGEWGLAAVEPHPRTAIGLHGPPGTGKTMVAHALARHLGKRILPARASQLESKYHGEGGKYLAALFEAARRAEAVLFVDEAESLLSRRFESVSQGSEHAVNTLRSELVQHLDVYEGVVIFATNLVGTYDPAFNSRLHHVRIPEPDLVARKAIWKAHLPDRLPLDADVSIDRLATTEHVVGRDIKRVVINAAVAAARRKSAKVTQADLDYALAHLLTHRPPCGHGDDPQPGEEVTDDEKQAIADHIATKLPRDQ